MAQDDAGERSHDATPRRLEEARRRGDVARSADLTAAAAWVGLWLAAASLGAGLLSGWGQAARSLWGTLGPAGDPARAAWGLAGVTLAALAPILALPAAAALVGVIGQRALVVAPSRLAPDLSRISPLSNLRQKLGRQGLVEFAKSLVKMTAVALAVAWLLWLRRDLVLSGMALPPGAVLLGWLRLLAELLGLVAGLMLAVGLVDLLWQRHSHAMRLRMTRSELMQDLRESEGDPRQKAERLRLGRERANNRMMQDVPGATVVIVNPTHYAVALRWAPGDAGPPVCAAKGVDAVAARIRARAIEAGVPIRHDPPTARMLHASVEVGAAIRPEHYLAVAAAIRFAEAVRQRAAARAGGAAP